ncbi:MAG: nucleotidyltransferase substrate binding protein [Candidatus Margulisbacteria bacterium]|jgi:nucleotidyltransferase substrate binding protein (TIGR01987 family)|nr:nucleotidyltransferase substrate binding protein [Candidatus Margulisiibacteriota bacterium]
MALLDLTSFEKAIATLGIIWSEYAKNTDNVIVRDSVIHRFEYTYELAFKMLKRYLELTEPSSETISELSFQNIIRLCSERGLLACELEKWKEFRERRNITVHTYNETMAVEVITIIESFLTEARFLLGKLKERMPK